MRITRKALVPWDTDIGSLNKHHGKGGRTAVLTSWTQDVAGSTGGGGSIP